MAAHIGNVVALFPHYANCCAQLGPMRVLSVLTADQRARHSSRRWDLGLRIVGFRSAAIRYAPEAPDLLWGLAAQAGSIGVPRVVTANYGQCRSRR